MNIRWNECVSKLRLRQGHQAHSSTTDFYLDSFSLLFGISLRCEKHEQKPIVDKKRLRIEWNILGTHMTCIWLYNGFVYLYIFICEPVTKVMDRDTQ